MLSETVAYSADLPGAFIRHSRLGVVFRRACAPNMASKHTNTCAYQCPVDFIVLSLNMTATSDIGTITSISVISLPNKEKDTSYFDVISAVACRDYWPETTDRSFALTTVSISSGAVSRSFHGGLF